MLKLVDRWVLGTYDNLFIRVQVSLLVIRIINVKLIITPYLTFASKFLFNKKAKAEGESYF